MVRADDRGPRLQDRAREVHRRHRRDPRVQREGPARPRRHDQRREERRDRAHPQEEEDPARRPQREAPRERGVRRRAGGPQGRHHRLAPTWPAAAPTSSSAATRRCSPSSSSASKGRDAGHGARGVRRSSSRSTRRPARPRATRSRELGGLHILGTERHESRRIDNQLRGRAGRQGDPGSSRFYLSLEDDLMRIFAGDRVKT